MSGKSLWECAVVVFTSVWKDLISGGKYAATSEKKDTNMGAKQ